MLCAYVRVSFRVSRASRVCAIAARLDPVRIAPRTCGRGCAERVRRSRRSMPRRRSREEICIGRVVGALYPCERLPPFWRATPLPRAAPSRHPLAG